MDDAAACAGREMVFERGECAEPAERKQDDLCQFGHHTIDCVM